MIYIARNEKCTIMNHNYVFSIAKKYSNKLNGHFQGLTTFIWLFKPIAIDPLAYKRY